MKNIIERATKWMYLWNCLDIKSRRVNCNVLKTGSSVRPVRSSTGHKTGPIQCKKPFFDQTRVEPVETVVEPVVKPTGSLIFFFQVKTTSF